jgi:signal transduction histidine kinase
MRAELAQLHGSPLVALGARLRRIAEGRRWTTDQIAAAIVDLIWDAIAPSAALVRAYRTRPLGALHAALQDRARAQCAADELSAATRCLVLAGSRGIEPAWNDVAASHAHRVIPLAGESAMRRTPMVAALLDRLRVPLQPASSPPSHVEPERVFHVADAVGNPLIPLQRELVLRHGVRSVVGFGGPLPDGEALAVIVFATTAIPEATAGQLDVLGVHARLALLDATDHTLAPDLVTAIRARSLDELLRLQEHRFQLAAEQLVHDRERETARAEQLRERSGAQTDRLERSQRAMLNVIEDLREARGRLEVRVAERTAELEARNRELEQFAYIASHDLQEPLRTVAGYLQLIEQRYGDRLDSNGHEFIEFAVTGARRMQELIEALLAYSRVASREHVLAQVALDDVLSDTLDSLERAVVESGAQIRATGLPVVHGDRVQLGQLLQNLIANAIKFRGEAAPEISIEAAVVGDRHVIEVHDRGIGFDNRHAERIFLLFRRLQRKHPGTGIGLAICKKIVERHGGTIRASSVPGQRTTFQFTLPVGAPP